MKKIVLIVVGVLILLAIPITVYLVSQRQEIRQRAAPATTLSLSPGATTANVGDTFTVEAKIDTAANQVIAMEIHLTFDPNFLQAQSITNGALFPNILTSGVVDSGIASIAVGAASSAAPVTGTGTAAVIRFKALAKTPTPTSIRFASTTFVGALGESSTNVLVGTSPGQVTINGITSSASQSANTASQSANLTPSFSLSTGSSTSGQASASALSITSPQQNSIASSGQPTIIGKATPGLTVTIVIHSTTTITATVTADANGNWSYTPTAPLDPGSHSVIASATDPTTGQVQTSTIPFVVASGATSSASMSAIPVTGSIENTIIFLSVGVLMFLGGLFLPVFSR